jgi:hypothetical protein
MSNGYIFKSAEEKRYREHILGENRHKLPIFLSQ